MSYVKKGKFFHINLNITASTVATVPTSKRRLRESNSIEDSKDVIKSPKPSAKTKKIDQETNKNRNSSQLVQTHEVTNRGHQDKRGEIFNHFSF